MLCGAAESRALIRGLFFKSGDAITSSGEAYNEKQCGLWRDAV